MKVELISVWDEAAARYIDPWVAPTIEFAIRGFRQACETEGHQFGLYPEDYSLWHVGSFDVVAGVLEPIKPHRIALASSFVGHGSQIELPLDGAEAARDELEHISKAVNGEMDAIERRNQEL